MRFSWDARKSEANLSARGFDFEFASLVFDGPTLERVDDRADYGERRVSARETVRRIISARRSNRQERKNYDQAYDEEA